jgi:hypothetical protein
MTGSCAPDHDAIVILDFEHEDQEEDARHEARQPPAPARLHVDDRLPDHRATRHAPDEAGGRVGQPLAQAFLVPVRGRVGQVVDDVLRHQAFEKAHDGDGDRIWEDDRQGLEVEGDVRDQEHRQRVGQRAHVAHRPQRGRR